MLLRLLLAFVVFIAVRADHKYETIQKAAKRAVGTKWKLLCGTKPVQDARVTLFRVPQNKKDDPDQILAQKKTASNGLFSVEGNTNGFQLNETTIEGVISVFHNFDGDPKKDPAKNGYRRVNIHIPEEFVALGAKPKKTLDIGTINLEIIFPGEKTGAKIVELDDDDDRRFRRSLRAFRLSEENNDRI